MNVPSVELNAEMQFYLYLYVNDIRSVNISLNALASQ